MRKLQTETSYFPYNIFFATLILSLIIFLSFSNDKSSLIVTNTAAQNGYSLPCKCVIFRLDDISDFDKNKIQPAILDHFITENKKLIAAIIVGKFGNLPSDGTVYTKVKEGYDKGLFELALHGLNHIKYSELTKEQQKEDFIEANNKLLSLFGNKSRIFVPPFNEFNSDTIKAMSESGLDIFSTSYRQENITPNPYKVSTPFTTHNKIQVSEVNFNESDSRPTLKNTIYHVPFNTALLHLIRDGYIGGNLTEKVLSNVNNNIDKYGFSVITLHPTDFATFNSSSGSYANTVDPNKFQVLVNIIDGLESGGISFADYSDIIPAPFSKVIPNLQQQEQQLGIKDTRIGVQPAVEILSFPTSVAFFDDNNISLVLEKARF
jgi:peptidoglycan/xylan/chitin deacetylase (PgdA/CDA1 family)